jgi:hypothetical protein
MGQPYTFSLVLFWRQPKPSLALAEVKVVGFLKEQAEPNLRNAFAADSLVRCYCDSAIPALFPPSADKHSLFLSLSLSLIHSPQPLATSTRQPDSTLTKRSPPLFCVHHSRFVVVLSASLSLALSLSLFVNRSPFDRSIHSI